MKIKRVVAAGSLVLVLIGAGAVFLGQVSFSGFSEGNGPTAGAQHEQHKSPEEAALARTQHRIQRLEMSEASLKRNLERLEKRLEALEERPQPWDEREVDPVGHMHAFVNFMLAEIESEKPGWKERLEERTDKAVPNELLDLEGLTGTDPGRMSGAQRGYFDRIALLHQSIAAARQRHRSIKQQKSNYQALVEEIRSEMED